MKKNHYISGEWNVTCDVCAKKIKAHEAKQRWDGFIVCPADFENRQPQDFVKAHTDKITVPFTRPIPPEAFRLRTTLDDMVMVTDDDTSGDYLVSNPDYFLEDYLQDMTAFRIVMGWNRDFADTELVVDTASFSVTKPFVDSVTITENIFPRKTITRAFSDSATTTDSGGIIFWGDYVDSTYFAEHYVGTTIPF